MCNFLCPFPSTQLSPQVLVQPKTDLPPLALSFLSCAIVLAKTSHSLMCSPIIDQGLPLLTMICSSKPLGTLAGRVSGRIINHSNGAKPSPIGATCLHLIMR